MATKINKPIGRFVSISSLADLKPGDIIRGRSSHMTYMVTDNYGSHVTAVRTQDVTNPPEWEVLRQLDTQK